MSFKTTIEDVQVIGHCDFNREYCYSVVDIVEIKKLNKVTARVAIVPQHRCIRTEYKNGTVIEYDMTGKRVECTVKFGSYGWYAELDSDMFKKKTVTTKRPLTDSDGKFIYDEDGNLKFNTKEITNYYIKFYDAYNHEKTAYVLACTAALVSYALGSNHRKNAKPDIKGFHSCINCSSRVTMQSMGQDTDLSVPGYDVSVISSPNPIKMYCSTLGKPILQDFDEFMDNDHTGLNATNGDRFKHIHGFKGNIELSGKLTNASSIKEAFAINLAHNECPQSHVLFRKDEQYDEWQIGSPKAYKASIHNEFVELGDVWERRPFAQLAGIRVRARWF